MIVMSVPELDVIFVKKTDMEGQMVQNSRNSNSITFKDNDHIQRSHSHSRHKN